MNEQPTFLQRMASLRDENARLRAKIRNAWLAIISLVGIIVILCVVVWEVAQR